MVKWLFIFLAVCAVALLAGFILRTSISAYERSDDTFNPEPLFFSEGEHAARIAITFVGDIMLARDVENHMRTYGASYPYTHIAEYLDALYVIGNFEAAVPAVHVPTPSMMMRFSVDPNFVPSLATAGFTHLSLANNHSFDFGREGYVHARQTIAASDMEPFGDPYQLSTTTVSYIEIKDHTVALIGVYAVVANPSREEIAMLMDTVGTESDVQIAYIHWGNEYELVHSRAQENLAHDLVWEGVDLIIGHHPHVVQDVQIYEGVPVLYSLGNFVFDQYFSDDVQEGLMATLEFSDSGVIFLELTPVSSINSRVAPRIMTGHERTVLLLGLAERSDTGLREAIQAGTIPLSFRSNELRVSDISI